MAPVVLERSVDHMVRLSTACWVPAHNGHIVALGHRRRVTELARHLEEVALDRQAVTFGQIPDIGLVGRCVQARCERSVPIFASGLIPCEGVCDFPSQYGSSDALTTAIRANGSTEVDASPLSDDTVAASPRRGHDSIVEVVSDQRVRVRA